MYVLPAASATTEEMVAFRMGEPLGSEVGVAALPVLVCVGIATVLNAPAPDME